MALSNTDKLISLGMPPELAKVVAEMVATGTYTDADAEAAIANKTEIAALTGGSSAADIVTALQA